MSQLPNIDYAPRIPSTPVFFPKKGKNTANLYFGSGAALHIPEIVDYSAIIVDSANNYVQRVRNYNNRK